MAQVEEYPRKYFAPSAGTTELDYSDTWTAYNASEVKLVKNNNELVNPDDFSVDISTGVITLVSASVEGDKFGAYRSTTIARSTNLIKTGNISIQALDDDLDKLIRIMQELAMKADLCLRYDNSVNISAVDLTIPAGVAGGILQFNDDLELVAVVPD